MRNLVTKLDGSTLTVTIQLDGPTQPSSTGKTDSIASTEGNKQVATVNGRPVYLGVNVYAKR
ncbi:MAG TPA: hypothetical protein VMW52_05470 [Phycisphaerae bacterium]|nr:hypothetical protein [Phycisphaerae bacterium]